MKEATKQTTTSASVVVVGMKVMMALADVTTVMAHLHVPPPQELGDQEKHIL